MERKDKIRGISIEFDDLGLFAEDEELQLKPHRFPSSSSKKMRKGTGQKPELDIRWLHLGQPYLSLAGIPVSALSESYASFSKKESDELERTFLALSPEDQLATRLKNPSKEQVAKLEKESQRATEEQKKNKTLIEVEKEADELMEEEERTEQAVEDADTEMTIEELEVAEGEMGVPIAKDGLFEVDVKQMKLYPVFWLHKGPNIPVRRGRWFYDEKTPCPEELADDLEKGYLAAESWKTAYPDELTGRLAKNDDSVFVPLPTAKPLGFGSHVLYQDESTAEVVYDKESITSKLSQTFWAALRASGTFSGGTLVYRGWDAVRKSESDAAEPSGKVDLEEGVEVPVLKENGEPGEPAASEVKELFLVVHGIGQQLASTHESFNSVYDSNTLRIEAQKQAKGEAVKEMMGGSQVQFLPIQWRGSLKFKQAATTEEDETHNLSNRFALEDITLKKSIPYVRELINNVLLDIPFYLSKHRESMIEAVATEANRTYRLWTRRHPNFEKKGGRVHIIGHSLGSALVANILSNQPTLLPPLSSLPKQVLYKTRDRFIFSTHSLFLVGSPLGLFLHIEQSQIVPRRGRERTSMDAPVGLALDRAGRFGCFSCDRLYNIFEPADPVAYMLNATVDGSLGRKIHPISIPSATQSTLDSVFGSFSELAKSLPALPNLPSLPTPPWASQDEEDVSKKKVPRFPEQKVLRQTAQEKAQTLSLAEQRFLALNPHGSVDFFLPAPSASLSEYVDMVSAHGLYWSDPSFAAFLLTEVFSNPKTEDEPATVQTPV